MSTGSWGERGWEQQLASLRTQVHLQQVIDPARDDALAAVLEQLSVLDEEIISQNAELRATCEALSRECSRYQELFDLAPDAYLLTDLDGVICEANQAASTLLRIDRQFLRGKPLQVFVPQHERHEFRTRTTQVRNRTRPAEWRLRLLPRESAAVHVVLSVAPFRNRRGVITGLQWSIRDISDRIESDADVAPPKAQLRSERAAREEAGAANRVNADVLTTLSYELRTPLDVVLGLVFRLKHESLQPSQYAQALATIERNAHELARLVEDLLGASVTVELPIVEPSSGAARLEPSGE